MKCKKCNTEHDGKFGSGKFCSRSCANSRQFSQESKNLKSRRNKSWWKNLSQEEKTNHNIKLVAGRQTAQEKLKEIRYKNLFETPIEELSHQLRRKRIILEQENQCNRCEIDTWLNEPLVLELEHKDGNSKNNTRENLECLCPNCHSLTDTWRGRNKNKKSISDETLLEVLKTEKNIHQALQRIGIASKGTNYARAKKLLKTLDR